MLSPEYRPHFQALIAALASGMPSLQAMTKMYGKPLETVAQDVRAWTDTAHNMTRVSVARVDNRPVDIQVANVSPLAFRSLMAELLLAIGDLDRAEALYRDLARQAPRNPDMLAALGTIALRKGDRESARKQWKQAIELGMNEPILCYSYASLAQDAGLSADEVRPVLETAIPHKPDFDDARYSLALLESNTGHYETAVEQLRAMRTVAPVRAYAYWSAMAYALNELGRRDESQAAAQQAMKHAATPAERSNGAQLAYVAQTDLAVQFTRDANGHTQLVTTRVPHNTADWNPFIEPADRIRRVQATLRELHCSAGRATGVGIDTAQGPLSLAIPDASHVLMRKAPSEFTCGPQPASSVIVEYAASETRNGDSDGVLRGMEFR